jgi:carboxypeptidase PM20D1
MKLKKVIGISLLVIVGSVLTLVLVNTLYFTSKQKSYPQLPPLPVSDEAILNLLTAIKYRTVSYFDSSRFDSTQFLGFHQYLVSAYPLIHQMLDREVVNGYSLLYTWTGRDTSRKSLILTAHMDVVPVEEETLQQWTSDPFTGTVRDGWIQGRGAVDNKMNVIAILESVENLLKSGYSPERTVYLVFGHDEEMGGRKGAALVARLLKHRGVLADLLIDEGGYVTREKFPEIESPIALVGTSEKSYLNLKLTAELQGGHSSMPEDETAIEVISESIAQLHEHKFPAVITPSTAGFIEHVGPSLPFAKRMVFANASLFEGLIVQSFAKSPVGNAMVRTIATPTIVNAGIKENIVPTKATAIINARLLPDDSATNVIKTVREIIDPRIAIEMLEISGTKSSFTPVESNAYELVEKCIRSRFPDTLVTPFLVIGGTDSRHFNEVADYIIRFTPMYDPNGFHGINESVSVESFRQAITFYQQLIEESDKMLR